MILHLTDPISNQSINQNPEKQKGERKMEKGSKFQSLKEPPESKFSGGFPD